VARNIDRKQLKNPDQFLSFWSRVGAAISANRKQVIGGVVAILVAVFGAWGVSALMEKRSADSSRSFSRIERIAAAELLPAAGDAPKDMTPDVPHFKTEKERLEAALKEADSFLSSHKGRLRDEAMLLKAKYLLALGRAGEAAPIYQELVSSRGLDDRLRFLAVEGLAYAQEVTGQVDQAIATFGKLADDAGPGGFYRDRGLYNKARLLEKKGNGKEAEKLFREILEKAPTTSLREEINDRLASLDGK
jgi:tetratricopeptide (TPR) repeat protein